MMRGSPTYDLQIIKFYRILLYNTLKCCTSVSAV